MISAFLVVLLSIFCLAEDSPEAEYPYPKTRSIDSAYEGAEKPLKKGNRGEYFYDTKKKRKPKKHYQGIEKPNRIGSDGSYYYKDTKKSDKLNTVKGMEEPIDRDSDGGYYYSTRKKKKKKPKSKYTEAPSKVKADGTYMYDVDVGETKNTFSFRGGMFGAPDISSKSGAQFSDVYGEGNNFVLALEYDWLLTEDLFFKFASGIVNLQGQGQFSGGATGGRQPKETFQFFIFPNTFTLSYKLQVWDIQWLTPYVEGGPGYFTFIESRSDADIFEFNGDTTKIGGAFVATATGGVLISLSRWMSGSTLYSEYGATQVWLDLQYKQIFGLDDRKDFSSNMITGGFAVGF